MLHRLRAPVNSFEFNLAAVLPGGRLNAAPEATPQGYNLQVDIVYGGPAILIRVLHAAPERWVFVQGASPPVFLQISTHFTATPGILPLSSRLKLASIRCSSRLSPGISDNKPPACALRPVIPINACALVLPQLLARVSWCFFCGNVNEQRY